MKRLVLESQQALENGDFSKSLTLAEEALETAEGKENPKLSFLAGRAALEGKKYEAAVKHLTKASELDQKFMPPLMHLANAFEQMGRFRELAFVKYRQMELATEKNNMGKAASFAFQYARALENSNQNQEGLEAYEKCLAMIDKQVESNDPDSEDLIAMRKKLVDSVVWIQVSYLYKRTNKSFFLRCMLDNLQNKINEFDPNAPLEEIKLPLSQATYSALVILESWPLIEEFCAATRQLTATVTPTSNPEAFKVWCIVTNVLILRQLEGDEEISHSIAMEAIEKVRLAHTTHVSSTALLWRAWAAIATLFSANRLTGEARRASDLSLVHLKQARELSDEDEKRRAEIKTQGGQQAAPKKIFVLGGSSAPQTDEDRAAQILKEKREEHQSSLKLLRRVISSISVRLWLDRCEMFSRWYFLGSPGFAIDLSNVIRFAKEGLSQWDALTKLPFVLPSRESKILLVLHGLEATSHLAHVEGGKESLAFAQKLEELEGPHKEPSSSSTIETQRLLSLALYGIARGNLRPNLDSCAILEAVDSLRKHSSTCKPSLSRSLFGAIGFGIFCKVKQLPEADSQRIELVQEGLAAVVKALSPHEQNLAGLTVVTGLDELKSLFAMESGAVPRCTPNLPWLIGLQGGLLWFSGDTATAHALLLKAAQLDSTLGEAFAILGDIYKNDPKSVKCLEKAFLLNPKDRRVLNALTRCYWAEKKMDFVEAALKRTITEVEALARKGNDIGEGTSFSNTLLDAWVNLGRLHLFQNKYSDAATCFQKAISIQSNAPDNWQGLGDAYRKMGRFTAAARAFEEAESIYERESVLNAERAYALFRLGRLLLVLHQPEKSLECLLRSNEIAPRPITGWAIARTKYVLAKELIRSARYEAAIEHAFEAIRYLQEENVHQLQAYSASYQVEGDIWSMLSSTFPKSMLLANVPPGFEFSKVTPDYCNKMAISAFAKQIHQQPWLKAAWKKASYHSFAFSQQSILCRPNLRSLIDSNSRLQRRLSEISITLDPLDADSWNLLGCSYVLSLSTSEKMQEPTSRPLFLAQHSFVRSIQLDMVNSGPAWNNFASLLLSCGNLEAARAAVTHSPNDDSISSTSWSTRSRIEMESGGSKEKAMASLECAIDAAGDGIPSPSALQPLLQYVLNVLFPDEQEDIPGLLRSLPSLTWGRIQQVLERYVRRCDEDPVAQFCLGMALRVRGAMEQAANAFDAAEKGLPGIARTTFLVNLHRTDLSTLDPPQEEAALLATAKSIPDKTALEVFLSKCVSVPSDPEWIFLAYKANPTTSLAERCADIDPNKFAKLVFANGPVEHLTIVRDMSLSADVKCKVLLALNREKGCPLREQLKALHCAPWSAENWAQCASDLVGFALPKSPLLADPPTNEKVVDCVYHCSTAAQTLLSNVEIDEQLQSLQIGISSVLACALLLKGEYDKMQSVASRMYHSFPYSDAATRILAFASLATATKTKCNTKASVSAALFRKLCAESENPNVFDLSGKCDALIQSGADHKEIQSCFEQLKLTCTNTNVAGVGHLLAARWHALTGQVKLSLVEYTSALKHSPKAPLLWLETGFAARGCGDETLAHFCFENASDCAPFTLEVGRTSRLAAAEHIGSALQLESTLVKLEEVLKAYPGDVDALFVRSSVLLRFGDKSQKKWGKSGLKKILTMDPSHGPALSLLGSIETVE